MNDFASKMIELYTNVYVIPGDTNVGIICKENENLTEVYLIDSGSTEIEGEYILKVISEFFNLKEQKYIVKSIFTTHGHADHCGAHNYIKEETGCTIYAPKHEQCNMETPIVQGCTLWGGYPPHELRTLYFKPGETYVDDFIGDDKNITISKDINLSFMELHGHSYCSVAIIINLNNGKKIIFTGDSIFPKAEIGRYWVPLIINPAEFMESLDKICSIKNVEWCIPSHGDFLTKNIEETAELNKIAILSTRMCILECLKDNKHHTSEDIIKYVADKNNLNMTISQYALISSTVRSYLSVMHDAKEIKISVDKNRLYFYLAPSKT